MNRAAPPHNLAAAYGLLWESDLALTQFREVVDTAALPDVIVQRVAALAIREPLRPINKGTLFADGFRFGWADEATFDVHNGNRVDYLPGPGWLGEFPLALYGTVAGMLLAWRGATPFHACAVELDGKAVLICGSSGAGKSSLTAGLMTLGARLLSDDLSVVSASAAGLRVLPGRPTIRLYPKIAEWMTHFNAKPIAGDSRGKVLIDAGKQAVSAEVPLRAIIVIGAKNVPVHSIHRLALLRNQLFRPGWMSAIPAGAARLDLLKAIEATVPFLTVAAVDRFDLPTFQDRAATMVDRIRMVTTRAA